MASNWARAIQVGLARGSQSLPQGQWFQIPIYERGIQRIGIASFPGELPTSDPQSWQVYAPYFEGKSLPFGLKNDEPTPANLKAISSSGNGLTDGVFSGEDDIIFFAQPLNDDFKGNNFTHTYGRQRYYWLCIPDDDSIISNQVMPEESSSLSPTETILNYEKRIYHEAELHNQLHSGKSWVGEKLTGSTDQFTLTFDDDYLDMNSAIKLNALMILDYDSGNYRDSIHVKLNGLPFNVTQSTSSWYSKITLNGSAVGMLEDGLNVLRLEYSSTSNNSIVYLDSLRLAYSRLLAASDDCLFGAVTLPGKVTRLIIKGLPFHGWANKTPD